jgi:hypothetical protein
MNFENDEQPILKKHGNNYEIGQYVMAQQNRPKNPANIKYCIGKIHKKNGNGTYTIKFNNNKEKVLTYNYFYANIKNDLQEKLNYENKLKKTLEIGLEIIVISKTNKKNIPMFDQVSNHKSFNGLLDDVNIMQFETLLNDGNMYIAKIKKINNDNTITVQQRSSKQINNVKLDQIIVLSCNPSMYTFYRKHIINKPIATTTTTTTTMETDEENTQDEPSIKNNCNDMKRFDTYGFIVKNRTIFGITLLIFSIITLLMITNKHMIGIDFNTIASASTSSMVGNIINKIITFLLSIVSLFSIMIFVLLFKKSWFSMGKLVIYGVVIALCAFMYYLFRNTNGKYVFEYMMTNDNSMNKTIKMFWGLISSFSVAPFYLLLFLIFIIPNYLLKLLRLENYQINFIDYLYGKIPLFLSPLLYILVIIAFFCFYCYMQAYCFSEYVLMPIKYSKYYDYTTSIKYRINQIFNNIKNFFKKYSFTTIYIAIIVGYFVVRKIMGKIFTITFKTILIIIVGYLLVKYGIGGTYKLIKEKIAEIKEEKEKMKDMYDDVKDSLDANNNNAYIF